MNPAIDLPALSSLSPRGLATQSVLELGRLLRSLAGRASPGVEVAVLEDAAHALLERLPAANQPGSPSAACLAKARQALGNLPHFLNPHHLSRLDELREILRELRDALPD